MFLKCLNYSSLKSLFKIKIKNEIDSILTRSWIRSLCSNLGSNILNTYTTRTHHCGQLRAEDDGKDVTLVGWIQFQRIGKFITLRDAYGVTQLYSEKGIKKLDFESVVKVNGTVKRRPPKDINPDQSTGEIEVIVRNIERLNSVRKDLPFVVRDFKKQTHVMRLQNRYMDLRNPDIQRALRTRSEFGFKIREFLCQKRGFIEVETPTLVKRTPGV